MVAKTKHEFVDDNPYLVYSGDLDTSYDGASESGGGGGGGGGDAGDNTFYVTVTGTNLLTEWTDDQQNPEILSADKSYAEISQAVADGKNVIVKTPKTEEGTNFALLPLVYYENPGTDTFFANFNLLELIPATAGAYVRSYFVGVSSNSIAGFAKSNRA